MEYVLELEQDNKLKVPDEIIQSFQLQPGDHFMARVDGGRFTIERVPFSSLEQANALNKSIEGLQTK